jgi:hypothetical protein
MSEEGEFEVRALHEELIEEETKRDQLAQRVAVMTAILSTLGAVFSFQSGHTQTEASFLKSGSIAKLTAASDRWAQYQSKSTRAYVATVTALVAQDGAVKAQLEAEAKRLELEKDQIRQQAEHLQTESERLSQEAEDILRPHRRLSLAMTFVQISIALSSLTVLTRRKWLFALAGTAAAIGVGIAVISWLAL